MPHGLDRFASDAEGQARFMESRRVAAYAPLLRALARLSESDDLVRGALLAAWSEREFSAVYDRPLLLLAAIRCDALADPAHPLAAALRAVDPDPSVISDAAIHEALAAGRAVHGSLRTRGVQTNEVTRAITWRLPLAAWAAAKDVVLVDLGCSAGLNLVADRVGLGWTDAGGAPLELAKTGGIVARVGFDREPVDPRDPAARAWLRACLWPGQRERHERLDRALDAACRALDAGELELGPCDAREMPSRLDALTARGRVLAYQTVFIEYLPAETRSAYEAGMRAFLARHPERAMWTELEGAPRGSPGPAEIRVHTAAGDRVLASCEYHPTACALRA
jgi:hypothetical protein